MSRKSSYHHGDLRTELIRTALELISERGIEALSVTEVSRRIGVSVAAPYRHFPSRDSLLAAVASAAAHDLSSEFREAIPELGATAEDITFAAAREALGTAAGIYVHFTARHRAGFDLIFAAPLQGLGDESLIDAGRSVMDVLIPPSLAVTGDPLTAIRLVEQIISSAHGYATLFLSGFYARRSTNVSVFAEEASETARALALCASRTQ